MNDELFDEKIAVLNHDAGCSLFYSGGCTCDLQARRAKVEAKIEKHDAAHGAAHNAARIDEIAAWWAEWRKRTPPAENPTPDALVLLDEIERLRVENERLRETLQALVDEKLVCNVREGDGSYIDVSAWCRAALEKKP